MKSSTLTSRAAWRSLVVGDLFVAQADIFGQRAGKEERILQNDGEVLAQRGQVLLAQVDAIHQNLPRGHIVEAHHQAGERGFPAPVWPTMATVCPGSTVKETSFRIHSMPSIAASCWRRGSDCADCSVHCGLSVLR